MIRVAKKSVAMVFASLAFVALQVHAANAQNDGDVIGQGVADLPIFDAHLHYKEPAWGPYPVDRVVEMMDRNGVAMGLVSSTPDKGTIMLLGVRSEPRRSRASPLPRERRVVELDPVFRDGRLPGVEA